MTDTELSNPLLAPHLPLFEQINIEEMASKTIRTQIDAQRENYAAYEKQLLSMSVDEHTYSNVMDELSRICYPLSKTYGIISHLSSVCDSKTLRDIKDKFRGEVIEMSKTIGQSKVLFDAMTKVKTDDPHEARALELSIKGMVRGGVNLEDDVKDQLLSIDKKLSELTNTLNNNVLDSTKEFKYEITDEALMKSTPLWARELWCPDSPEKGPWTITLGGPSIIAALKHIPDGQIRKELYMAYISRADKNEEVIYQIMDLISEKAGILGFETYTEMSLDSKMASSEKEIIELLDDLQKVALPKAIEEARAIKEYGLSHGVDDVEPWDSAFWSERMREEQFDLKEEELKPYFSLDNVLRELFSLAQQLFGIYICQREEHVEVWHPSVRFFDVFEGSDSSGKLVAGFYLDPYIREETKRSGAWMDSCVDKDISLEQYIPIAYLVCNGSPPGNDKPSLLSFSDVETLFHEFGHGLQHMLTKVNVGDISGINGIEWDAVELPSQFMENWCYEKDILNSMAKHYETGETLPAKMYDSIIKQKNYGAAMGMMRQVSFSKLDLYLYTNWKSIRENEISLWDIQKEIFTQCCPYKKYLPEDRFLCTFQHIFSGYSAGYYSYKWAEVMSADCFGMFEEHPNKRAEIGRKFRNTVLSNGGSKPAMETFVDFRGRKPNVNALLRHNQLI